jgi:hypothetical protein
MLKDILDNILAGQAFEPVVGAVQHTNKCLDGLCKVLGE